MTTAPLVHLPTRDFKATECGLPRTRELEPGRLEDVTSCDTTP